MNTSDDITKYAIHLASQAVNHAGNQQDTFFIYDGGSAAPVVKWDGAYTYDEAVKTIRNKLGYILDQATRNVSFREGKIIAPSHNYTLWVEKEQSK